MKEKKPISAKRIVLSVVAVIVAIPLLAMTFMFALRGFANIPRVKESEIPASDNAYIVSATLMSAHRAGRKTAPENTMAAFSKCIDIMETEGYVIDILEFDLQLTKDERLVLLHDDTLDRTSNCEEVEGFGKDSKVIDHTLEELKTLEMWHDYDGTDFEEGKARICTLEEVFDYVITEKGYVDMRYIIEIKDSGAVGEKAMDKLYEIMVNYDVLDKVIVGTFQKNVTAYIDKEYSSRGVTRSASIMEVVEFYFAFCFNADLAKKNVGYSVLQIPTDAYIFVDLGKKSVIDYAHKYGIAVQFWTINDPKEIEQLIRDGADAIMTDYPDTACAIAEKLKNNA